MSDQVSSASYSYVQGQLLIPRNPKLTIGGFCELFGVERKAVSGVADMILSRIDYYKPPLVNDADQFYNIANFVAGLFNTNPIMHVVGALTMFETNFAGLLVNYSSRQEMFTFTMACLRKLDNHLR